MSPLVRLLLAMPGLGVPFLPFAYGVKPIEVLLAFDTGVPYVLPEAGASMLAVLIATWQLRRFLGKRVSTTERSASILFATMAMLPVSRHTLGVITQVSAGANFLGNSPATSAIALLLGWGMAVLNVVGLLRAYPRRQVVVATERYLEIAYLPNAIFCLMIFPQSPRESGAVLAGLACACYLAMAASVPVRDDAALYLPSDRSEK